MGNPIRTDRYLATMDQRRQGLRDDFARILTGRSDFVWELGSGHGHFLTAYAEAHPARLCLGIDLVAERVERATRKRDRARLANLHFIRAEARLFLEMLPPDVAFSDVFILFPDPWPKARHHKHRIIQPEVLEAIAARAAADCRVFFRTDFVPYFDDAKAVFQAHARWKLVDDPWPFEFETVFQSRAPAHHSLIARHVPANRADH
jgi:tRNA (guanine-N7-)-methyltransferase